MVEGLKGGSFSISRWPAPEEYNLALGLRVSLLLNLQTQEPTSTPCPCDISNRQRRSHAPPPSSSNQITTILMEVFCQMAPMLLTGLDTHAMSSLSDPSAVPQSLLLDAHIDANTPVPNAQSGVCDLESYEGTLILYWK